MIDKQAIGNKILSIRKDNNCSQIVFSKNLNISQQALSQIEKGLVLPSLDLLQKITSIYCIDYSFILGGNSDQGGGSPLGNKGGVHRGVHSEHIGIPLVEKTQSYVNTISYLDGDKNTMNPGNGIPYYEMLPTSAGDIFSFLSQAKPTSFIDLPQLTDCVAVLPVYGSSMKGVIEPGDLIAIKEVKTRDEFDPAVPYMVITEEHRMVKYLRVDENDQMVIWAESTNHAKIKLNVDNIKMVYAIKCVIRFF